MMRIVFMLSLIATLAACGGQQSSRVKLTFDGEKFRASAKPLDRSDRKAFEVRVRNASKSETGARQAAAYEATKYCIRWFGRSDLVWEVAPDDEAVQIQDNTFTVRGTCTG